MKFFSEHPNHGNAASDVRAAIDRIKTNVEWMKTDFPALSSWLIGKQTIHDQKL